MFWFSEAADFSLTLNNNFEIVLSGKTNEPTNFCSLTLVQRTNDDTPELIWQGNFPSAKFVDLLNLLSRLPKGFGPKEVLSGHVERVSKYV